MKRLFLRLLYILLPRDCPWPFFVLAFLLIPSIGWGAMYANNVAGGTFFIDTSSGVSQLNLSQNIRRMIKVVDTSGRQAYGYIGTAGTGETLGTENISNPDFNAGVTGWTASGVTLTSIAGGVVGNCGEIARWTENIPRITQIFDAGTGKVFKLVASWKQGTWSGDNIPLELCGIVGGSYIGIPTTAYTASWQTQTVYKTSTGGQGYIWVGGWATIGAGLTFLSDEVSVKQVLTPPTSGCSIYYGPNLVTNSWASVGTAFDWNAISYYAIRQPLTLEDWKERPGHIPGMHRWRVIR